MILQRIGIGRFQLGNLAPIQKARRQFVTRGGEIFEDIRPRGIGPRLALFAPFKAHLVEQDFTKLFGARQIKRLARQFMRFGLERRHFLRKGVGHTAQHIAVNADPRHFHTRQNGHKWAF